jgi:hypothetical protein
MTTEISTYRPGGLSLLTFEDAWRFAKMVANSDFAPKEFRGKPEACLLAIQKGAEVGLTPLEALQSIAVINGRPTIWGDAALALVQSSSQCLYVREYTEGDGDSLTAICEVQRRGYPQPTVAKFSVADAKKAGLWGKSGPWSQYPSRMLGLRARGFALRNAFADALRGLVTAEEAQDYQTPAVSEPTPSVVKVTAAAAAPVVPEDAMGKARLAISRATTFDMLDAIRTLVDKRAAEGVFDEAAKQALVGLIHQKAERLIGEDKGQEFAHEAAEHEVTA